MASVVSDRSSGFLCFCSVEISDHQALRDILHRHTTWVANGTKRKSKGRRLVQRVTLLTQTEQGAGLSPAQLGPLELTHADLPPCHGPRQMPLGANTAFPRLPVTGPQQSARLLLVSAAWLVWPFGGRCGGAAGSKAISGDLGR
jgi:hypothetical protein